MLKLDQIETFLLCAELKNMGLVAKALGVSTPAISQKIAQLETSLGTTLFIRESRPLQLTAKGRKLLVDGKRLLDLAKEVEQRAKSGSMANESLHLGLGETVTATLGPWLLAQLYNRVAELETFGGLSRPLMEKLQDRTLDVAVSTGDLVLDERWNFVEVYREAVLLVVGKKRHYQPSTGNLSDLAINAPLIGYNHQSSDQNTMNRLLTLHKARFFKRVLVGSSYDLIGLVAELGGFSLVPATNIWCGRQFLNDIDIFELPSHQTSWRHMYVVGDKIENLDKQDLVAIITRKTMAQYMLPELEAVSPLLKKNVKIFETF